MAVVAGTAAAAAVAVVVGTAAAVGTAAGAAGCAVPAHTAALVSAAVAPPVDCRRYRLGSARPTEGAAAADGRRSGRTCRSLRSSSSSCCAVARDVDRRPVPASHLLEASRPGWPPPAWLPTRLCCGRACPCAAV